MNQIIVNFTPCTPAPGAYSVKYRIQASGGAYTDAGVFFNSPAVFYDTVNPAGTCYEGYIMTDCEGVSGNPVFWESCGSGGPAPLSISLTSNCNPLEVPASYLVNGGEAGDVIVVRATFSGVITNTAGFTRADLDINSPDGTIGASSSPCYTDFAMHGFTITADTTITMTGTTAIVLCTAVVHNSTEDLTNVAITIISRNGNPEDISCAGCKINSATGGTC